jgi:hypothetical protein
MEIVANTSHQRQHDLNIKCGLEDVFYLFAIVKSGIKYFIEVIVDIFGCDGQEGKDTYEGSMFFSI